MEQAQRDRLSELVEELTTSGQPELNQDKMKEIKKICKVSTDCLDHIYHSVMSQLNQDHAEIRLSAFQIARELFSRSHHFRNLLVDNFQEFLELTVETDLEQPLPPPKEVAKKLKVSAIQTVQSWQASYGSAYKKLALGYHFLKQVKKVDFQDVEARSVAERRREEERQRRMDRIYRERVEAATRDMEESTQEIQATLTEMKSCLNLLLPDEFDLSDPWTANNSLQNSAPTNQCAAEDEQPCCSKDLREERECRGKKSNSVEEKKGKDEREKRGKKKKKKKSGVEEREERKGKDPENSQKGNKAAKEGEEEEEEQEEGMRKKTNRTVTEEERNEVGKEEKKEEGQEVLREGEMEEEMEDEEQGGLRCTEGQGEDGLDEDSFIRNSGLISHSYSLDISVDPDVHVKETEDNEAVISTILDLDRLITTKHLPAVQSWVQVFTKSDQQQLLRRALDLKKSLEAALQKCKELHIDCKSRVRRVMKAYADEEPDNDDDDDFEEVPEKEGFEPLIPDHLREEYGLEPSSSTSVALTDKKPPSKRPVAPAPQSSSSSSSRRLKRLIEEEQDPTSAAATLHLLKQRLCQPTTSSATSPSQQPCLGPSTSTVSGPSTSVSSSDKKALEAPVVPFGLDLYYWGQDQPSAGKIIKSASQHQFWVPCEMEEEVENEELSAEGRSRYISFPGTFTPVSHYCRAPLANGTLCQRQDRVKCPFHGPIIPRDQEGRPSRQEDRLREEKEKRRRMEEQPDWRDVELMREIEAATGEDLGSSRLTTKGKGKKKKYPNLSDLKQNANTARSRLQRKVFNKSSMRRVAEAMSKADRRKHDKFSNQFNYSLN